MTRRRVVCLDVDGTLTDGVLGPVLPGAADAVRALRASLPVRLVTNTTSVPHRVLAEQLIAQGLLDDADCLWTPALVARRALPERGHDRGLLIADPEQREDYAWFREDPAGPAVLLATEAHAWRIADLQAAFRRCLEGARLYTLTRNRYFKRGGELVTDVGAVAALVGYAASVEAETLGKPSRSLFEGIARDAGVRVEDLVMVGDDAEFDVALPMGLGLAGILVRTGKYRTGDEARAARAPTAVLDSVASLPGWVAAS